MVQSDFLISTLEAEFLATWCDASCHVKQEKQAINCQKIWTEKRHFDLSACFWVSSMMNSLYFPFNYPIFVSPEHTSLFWCLPRNHYVLFNFPSLIPPPSPADAPIRGLIPAPSSSNRWDEQQCADERHHGINQAIKRKRCSIKQNSPISLPRLFPPSQFKWEWEGSRGGETRRDVQCCWFPQRLSTHSCWVNNSDLCLIKITAHPPLRKKRQFENYSN